jgi:membrane-associated phospholipid phosphatase
VTPDTGAPRRSGVLGAVDDTGDRLFDRLRGTTAADACAAVLSNLSDHGIIWVLVAVAKACRGGWRRRRAVVGLGAAGVASYTVNRWVKRMVGRERPEGVRGPVPVRPPATSSFPSGHTLAAFCAAVVLGEDPAEVSVALGFAAAVAAARVQLRAHHLSDVLAGAAIGSALGVVVRAAVRAAVPRSVVRRSSE